MMQERDDQLINNVTRMVTFAKPSLLRLVLFTLFSTSLGIYQLSMVQGFMASFISWVAVTLLFIAMIEAARFGFKYDHVAGGWQASTKIVIGFICVFLLARFFDLMEWGPKHRMVGWSFGLWVGFILGVLVSQANKHE